LKWLFKNGNEYKLREDIASMVKRELLAELLDSKKIGVLKVILNSNEELYLNEIAKKSGVSITSTFRLLQSFVNLDLVEKKVWKTSKVYYCKNNDKIAFLKDLFLEQFDGIQAFLQASAEISGIQEIILHGQAKKDKANLLLIGNNIEQDKAKAISASIKNKGFDLSFVALTPDQYEQMAKMGLYSGDKKILRP